MAINGSSSSGDAARILTKLLFCISKELSADKHWQAALASAVTSDRGIHLGIFVEPYLSYVLDGTKSVESRFSKNRCPPWNRVFAGDILLIKRAGGPIVGIATVAQVWSYPLNPAKVGELKTEFSESLRAQDPSFWKRRLHSAYATLMRIEHVRSVTELAFAKRDRRGWVILQSRQEVLFDADEGATA